MLPQVGKLHEKIDRFIIIYIYIPLRANIEERFQSINCMLRKRLLVYTLNKIKLYETNLQLIYETIEFRNVRSMHASNLIKRNNEQQNINRNS